MSDCIKRKARSTSGAVKPFVKARRRYKDPTYSGCPAHQSRSAVKENISKSFSKIETLKTLSHNVRMLLEGDVGGYLVGHILVSLICQDVNKTRPTVFDT